MEGAGNSVQVVAFERCGAARALLRRRSERAGAPFEHLDLVVAARSVRALDDDVGRPDCRSVVRCASPEAGLAADPQR